MGRLTTSEVTKMASVVNEIVNIPVLTEGREQIVIEKIIKTIDNCLYELLPDEIYDTIHMTSDGVTPEEAEIIKNRISRIVNEQVSIPFISEEDEGKIIKKFLDLIGLALQKGKDLISSMAS